VVRICEDLVRVFSCLANPESVHTVSAKPAQKEKEKKKKKKKKRRSILEAKGIVSVILCPMLRYFRRSFAF
jgi:hypothetical protein